MCDSPVANQSYAQQLRDLALLCPNIVSLDFSFINTMQFFHESTTETPLFPEQTKELVVPVQLNKNPSRGLPPAGLMGQWQYVFSQSADTAPTNSRGQNLYKHIEVLTIRPLFPKPIPWGKTLPVIDTDSFSKHDNWLKLESLKTIGIDLRDIPLFPWDVATLDRHIDARPPTDEFESDDDGAYFDRSKCQEEWDVPAQKNWWLKYRLRSTPSIGKIPEIELDLVHSSYSTTNQSSVDIFVRVQSPSSYSLR